jgi:hypothetical protein
VDQLGYRSKKKRQHTSVDVEQEVVYGCHPRTTHALRRALGFVVAHKGTKQAKSTAEGYLQGPRELDVWVVCQPLRCLRLSLTSVPEAP